MTIDHGPELQQLLEQSFKALPAPATASLADESDPDSPVELKSADGQVVMVMSQKTFAAFRAAR